MGVRVVFNIMFRLGAEAGSQYDFALTFMLFVVPQNPKLTRMARGLSATCKPSRSPKIGDHK